MCEHIVWVEDQPHPVSILTLTFITIHTPRCPKYGKKASLICPPVQDPSLAMRRSSSG